MEIVEDPFVTRQAVVNVLSFGNPATEAPLRTLRRHSAVSDGVSVPLRTTSGRLIGRVHLYSALSSDAARLFRWHQPKAAGRLARKAAQIERSRAGRRVVRAIEEAASSIPVDADERRTDVHAQSFRAYVDMRRASSWEALEPHALSRSWVSDPRTWLGAVADDPLREAVHELSERVATTRANEPALARLDVTTRVGVIERIDPVAAELASPDGSRFIVPRRPLEREGLARVGQAVSVLLEELPGGRVVDFYAAAARLDRPAPGQDLDPFDVPGAVKLSAADSAWLHRVLVSEPTTVPLAPLVTGSG
jgi:hypothetical protein